MSLIVTYDFGTTSVKVAIVSGGRILAEANAEYPVSQPRPGWAEQDPARLWDAGAGCGRRALVAAGVAPQDVDAVVFVAPWKNIIPVDESGTVLRDAIIWMDGRAGAQATRLNEAAGRFVGTGQEYWPRLMWLKEHEPDVWRRARHLMGLTTYLRWRATGVVVTEPSDDFVHGSDPERVAQYAGVMRAAGLEEDRRRFAPPVASTAIVGELIASAADDLGLRAGTPVVAGFGDLPAITVGTGPVETGAAHLYFGTSSWLVALTDPGETAEAPLSFTLDGRWDGAVYPLQTGCLAYDWIVEQLYGAEKAHLHDGVQDFVNAEVAQVEAGSMDLLATHWLNGELPPLSKNAKGTFLNLTTSHDRRHMVRAMMESICYTHRWSIERFEASARTRLDGVRVVGGGASSEVWMQMLADVLQRRVVVPGRPRYVGALGAYYCGTVALGEAADLSTVNREVAELRVFEPNPDHAAVYDRLFLLYRDIHPALAGLYDRLNGPVR